MKNFSAAAAAAGSLGCLWIEDEGRTRDRPARRARLVGDDHAEAGRSLPVRLGGRGAERLDGGRNRLATLVHQPGIGELVLPGVGMFDIADCALDPDNAASDAFVTLGTDADRPFDRGGRAHLNLQLGLTLPR